MTRLYTDICNQDARKLLETLANKDVSPDQYKETMTELGTIFGSLLLNKVSNKTSDIYLACTVEDADFLAKGILLGLENCYSNIAFACFWNKRFSPFGIESLKVAPILKRYQEPSNKKVQYLIVVKSIISGASVVKTNLLSLLQKVEPEKILIVAPVVYKDAEQNLKDKFDKYVHSKFEFLYFAKDDERTDEGEVIPGVGGNVYLRLGFKGQDSKNEYIPKIVKERRSLKTGN